MDVDLVVRAKSGDREAFGQLAARSIGALDAAARLIIRDRERARDVVQETLVRAWRSLPTYGAGTVRGLGRAAARPGMYRRAAIDAAPRRRDRADRHVPARRRRRGGNGGRSRFLRRAFRWLDPEQRSLIVLHYYLDLPVAEVADALEMPVGTAKSRLFRARATLRAALDADERIDQSSLEGRPA